MGRERKRLLFTGQTGTGKSTLAEKIFLPRVQKYKEPWAIYDPNQQAIWRKYPAIDLSKYKRMTSGIYRIISPSWEDFFEVTFTYFKNGCVYCDDAGPYLPDKKDDDIYPNLIALRHPDHNIDIGFGTHAISETSKFILRNCHEMFLGKTGDNWKDCKDRISDHKVDLVRSAFDNVNADPDPHAFERIVILKTGSK